MKRYTSITKLSDNRFLNLFHLDALTEKGKPFDYFFVSRRKENEIKLLTQDMRAEGVVIYPVMRGEPERIVMIRQYRYPLGDYLYELPAGLIDGAETPEEAAAREMKEETGLDFQVYAGGDPMFRRAFFMGAGFTDESCNAVFGYADGEVSYDRLESSESIEVILADRAEARRILAEEKVSLRAAYLLGHFLRAGKGEPFAFLDAAEES